MTNRHSIALVLGLVVALATIACDADPEPADTEPTEAQDADAEPSESQPAQPADAAPVDTPIPIPRGANQMAARARDAVEFLRGRGTFDPAHFTDTVTFYIAPEGGGATRKVAREALSDRGNWNVGGYRLTPSDELTNLTTRVSRHFACQEASLATRYEMLARQPHVGTKLEPADGGSCLQTWNLTFVFAPDRQPPVITAVVYDQFEW